MLIGFFSHEDDPRKEALYRLGREFRLHEHKVQMRDSHAFLPREIEPFDGIFLTHESYDNGKVIDAYAPTNTKIFILEEDAEGAYFIGESPHVDLGGMRSIVEFLMTPDVSQEVQEQTEQQGDANND